MKENDLGVPFEYDNHPAIEYRKLLDRMDEALAECSKVSKELKNKEPKLQATELQDMIKQLTQHRYDDILKDASNIIKLQFINKDGTIEGEKILHLDLLNEMSPDIRVLTIETKIEELINYKFNREPKKHDLINKHGKRM